MIGDVKAVDFNRKVATLTTGFGDVDVAVVDPDEAARLLFQRVEYNTGLKSIVRVR